MSDRARRRAYSATGRVQLSDQVEQLDELIHAEGDGTAFFSKTHITQGMQDLIAEGLARLAGNSAQAIFHLKQAMGGGKTHLLVAFGLLANDPRTVGISAPGSWHDAMLSHGFRFHGDLWARGPSRAAA